MNRKPRVLFGTLFELVINESQRLVLLIAKKSGELEQVVSLDLMQVKLAAGVK